MSDIHHLIELLKSDNPNTRYDACEELRVSPQPLPQEAIDALNSATNDLNPEVADAAQRALALHALVSSELEQRQGQDMGITPTTYPNANKARDFSLGFFGWLIVWSFFAVFFRSLGLVKFVELFALVMPFILKRHWLGFGVVSCVITNVIVLGVLTGEYSLGLFVPFFYLFFAQ